MLRRRLSALVCAVPARVRGVPLCALLITACAAPMHANAQFELQDSTTTASLRGIASPGNGVAWASGTGGTVLRTEDGGFVWQGCAIPPGAERLDFRGVQAFDAQTALVMSSGKGDLSRVYKTTDGCRTWTLVLKNPDAEGFFDAMQFQPAEPGNVGGMPHGWLLGDPVEGQFALWASFDKGSSWYRLRAPGLTAASGNSGAFAASNSLLLLGYPLYFAAAQGWYYEGDVKNCTMGLVRDNMLQCFAGFHFSKRQLPMAHGNGSSGIFAIANFNDNVVAVGGDYNAPDRREGVASFRQANPTVSVRGRKKTVTPAPDPNWRPAQTQPHGYRSSVAYDMAAKTWITVGPNGTDISRDDGRNWEPLRPGAGDAADADRQWNALALPFVVGPHGRIGRLREGVLKPAVP